MKTITHFQQIALSDAKIGRTTLNANNTNPGACGPHKQQWQSIWIHLSNQFCSDKYEIVYIFASFWKVSNQTTSLPRHETCVGFHLADVTLSSRTPIWIRIGKEKKTLFISDSLLLKRRSEYTLNSTVFQSSRRTSNAESSQLRALMKRDFAFSLLCHPLSRTHAHTSVEQSNS